MRQLSHCAIAAACVVLSAVAARAAGDRENGAAIAERWCASCHLIGPEQESAVEGIPSFMAVARAADRDVDVLAGFLVDPHPPMPDLSLTRQEIQDVLAYIASLRDADAN